ncbi:MAG TPA: hypothetical protein PL002_15100, partial [Flavobacteriales bacterium]|nr:hypothetical protein [Flavobacteriales bacterium]
MKNLYTAIITGTALLLATAGQAQHTAHGKLAHRLLSVGQHGPQLQGEQRGGGPTNDDCGSVTAENLNIGGSVNFTGSTAGATDVGDYEAGSQLDGEAPSVWHAFTISDCADVTVSYCGTDPVFGNAWIVLATSCPASALVFNNNFDQTTCSDGNLTIRYLGLAAGTYYMPVMLDTAVANGPYTISVSA